MKRFLVFLTFLITLNGCERDDICIDAITPKLIIRFYNFDDETATKAVTDIEIKIEGFTGENDDDGYTDGSATIRTSTDSIALPLRTDINLTKYFLTINHTDEAEKNTDTLQLDYLPEPVFVGRSCGFKAIFRNVQYNYINENSGEQNWIKRIEVQTGTIENEQQAHVKIFH